jgi:hypothetical protein
LLFADAAVATYFTLAAGAKVVLAHNYGQEAWRVDANGTRDNRPFIPRAGANADYEVTVNDANTLEVTNRTGAELSCMFIVRWAKPMAPPDDEFLDTTDPRVSVVNP